MTYFSTNPILLKDYNDLRSYDGNNSIIIINDFTYTFNSISYTTKGGVFIKSSSGTENGITTFVTDKGDVYTRQWDGINIDPFWAEVGGKDASGQIYTTFNAGTGIANDNDRIISASTVGGNGSVVLLPKDKTIDFWQRVPLYEGQEFKGHNTICKRGDAIQSPLTSTAGIGTSTVLVADGSIFRIGMGVGIVDISAANGGQWFDENDGKIIGTITAISGNQITFANALTRNFIAGDVFFVRTQMFTNAASVTDLKILRFTDITFDGNTAGNNLTFDWRYNANVSVGDTEAVFDNCRFYNNPCENIFAPKCLMINPVGGNLGGSLVHVSSSDGDRSGSVIIQGGYVDGVNINYLAADHSEALITYSANSVNVNIQGLTGKNGGLAVIGQFDSNPDDYLIMSDCYFENFSTFTYGGTSGTNTVSGNIDISNCKLYNVNDIYFQGANVQQGYSFNKISLRGIRMINTRLSFDNVSEIEIIDVKNKYDDVNYTILADFNANPPNYNHPVYWSFRRYDRITINGLEISGSKTYNPFLRYGLALVHFEQVRKDSAGVNTEYFYGQDVNINNVTVANFKYGIFAGCKTPNGFSTRGLSADRMHVGVTLNDIRVYMGRDAAQGTQPVGVYVEPGVELDNCKIYSELGGFGIVAVGVNNNNSQETRLLGASVNNVKIYGADVFIGGNSNNHWNIRLTNTHYTGTLSQSTTTTANSIQYNNIKIDSTELPALTSFTVPVYKDWSEDSVLY